MEKDIWQEAIKIMAEISAERITLKEATSPIDEENLDWSFMWEDNNAK